MQVLASLVDDPQDLELTYRRTLSLAKGRSSPVLTDGGQNAIYVGTDWSEPEAIAFAEIRYGMPPPRVYDWDDATVDLVLSRSTGDAPAPTELDHGRRLW